MQWLRGLQKHVRYTGTKADTQQVDDGPVMPAFSSRYADFQPSAA